jgi:aminoglycoside 2'-N-acetyltransferase I
MTDHDWEHALGGVHALVWEGADLMGHASVIQRRLLHGGRALRTGYVEGVGVRADRRGRGHGAAMMDALETVVRGAYELGALGATGEAAAFYAARGWMLWRGPSSALTPSGIRRTEEDGTCIYVLPMQVPLDRCPRQEPPDQVATCAVPSGGPITEVRRRPTATARCA